MAGKDKKAKDVREEEEGKTNKKLFTRSWLKMPGQNGNWWETFPVVVFLV